MFLQAEFGDGKKPALILLIIRLITIYKKDESCYPKVMQERNTNQRKLILDLMAENYTHPTADEIYELARKRNPHISRGTVYRNLGFLCRNGGILKISVPDGPDHYDSTLREHYHFCCKNCGKMQDVPGEVKIETGAVLKKMADEGFTVTERNLVFTGFCPACRKSGEKTYV